MPEVFLPVDLTYSYDSVPVFTGVGMGEHGGLLGGALFGSWRIVPYLSPNKSAQGFIGNLVMSTVVAVGLQHVWSDQLPFPNTTVYHAGLGFALGFVGIIGDLFESYLKRSFQRKDVAAYLPGWGGVLDRIDGLLFNFPLLYYWLTLNDTPSPPSA